MVLAEPLQRTHEQYQVSVEAYKTFRRDGYLHVRNLVAPNEVTNLAQFTDDMMAGRQTIPGIPSAVGRSLTDGERRHYYERIHMPHRTSDIAERFLLHPRIVDVLEALIGPDVLSACRRCFSSSSLVKRARDSIRIPTTSPPSRIP